MIEIKFLLVDEGDEIINEHYSNITLYNFIESDGYLPGQLVLDCALNNMWFPVMNIDTIFLLQPYFSKKQLYKVLIIDTIECGVKLVQMIIKDTNIDVSDVILQSGIGQRLLAAMKTGIFNIKYTFYEYSIIINYTGKHSVIYFSGMCSIRSYFKMQSSDFFLCNY